MSRATDKLLGRKGIRDLSEMFYLKEDRERAIARGGSFKEGDPRNRSSRGLYWNYFSYRGRRVGVISLRSSKGGGKGGWNTQGKRNKIQQKSADLLWTVCDSLLQSLTERDKD